MNSHMSLSRQHDILASERSDLRWNTVNSMVSGPSAHKASARMAVGRSEEIKSRICNGDRQKGPVAR